MSALLSFVGPLDVVLESSLQAERVRTMNAESVLEKIVFQINKVSLL